MNLSNLFYIGPLTVPIGTIAVPVCVLLALSSCVNNDEMAGNLQLQDTKLMQAIDIAKEAYGDFYGSETRSASSLDIDPRNTYAYCAKQSRSEAPDTLFYVVNFGEQEGFAIVSNKSEIDPLIGITDCGHYNPEEAHGNPNFQYFMDGVIETLSNSSDDHSGLIIRRDLLEDCPPKVVVEWGQREPYNAYCDNGLTGCSNTAAAMIMSYFEQPDDIAMTAGYWDVHIMQLDWESMKLHRRQPDRCYEDDAEDTHDMLSKLMRQIGCDANSEYTLANPENETNASTGTYASESLAGLRRYGFSYTSPTYLSGIDYKNYLRNDYVFYVYGESYNPDGAHTWVFDGFKRFRVNYQFYQDFCHYNWGWDGKENGYYSAGVFAVSQADSYDNATYGTAYNFSSGTRFSAISYNH